MASVRTAILRNDVALPSTRSPPSVRAVVNAPAPDDDRPDSANGYEAVARQFLALRAGSSIGAGVVRQWAQGLPRGGSVLDLGCGSGEPVARVLGAEGLQVWGIDASPTLVAAFRRNLPQAEVACEAVEASSLFGRTFDGIVAIGLLFLLPEAAQRELIARMARGLAPGGEVLFTAPAQACRWEDVLTGRTSWSLGARAYRVALVDAGLTVLPSIVDEGGNHHHRARRVP